MTGIGLDQVLAQSQTLAQRQTPRLVRDEGIRATLDRVAVKSIRRDHSPQSRLGLQDRQLDRAMVQPRPLADPMRGRQPGQAAADDDHSIRFQWVARAVGQN
jgi:hypothetical protein